MHQVQTRRAEALSDFRTATPLHEQKKRHPAKRRVSRSVWLLLEKRALQGLKVNRPKHAMSTTQVSGRDLGPPLKQKMEIPLCRRLSRNASGAT
jgi:hypothetical protein